MIGVLDQTRVTIDQAGGGNDEVGPLRAHFVQPRQALRRESVIGVQDREKLAAR